MGEPKNLEIPSAYPHVEPHDVKDEHLIVMSTFPKYSETEPPQAHHTGSKKKDTSG